MTGKMAITVHMPKVAKVARLRCPLSLSSNYFLFSHIFHSTKLLLVVVNCILTTSTWLWNHILHHNTDTTINIDFITICIT